MDNSYTSPSPSPDERRTIRRYYFRISFILLTLLVVFNGISTLARYGAAAIAGGGIDSESLSLGLSIIRQNPVISAVYSYFFPLAADIAAFGVGCVVTNFNLRDKLRFKGFTGKELCAFTACSLGGSLIGSFIMIIVVVVFAVLYFASSGESSGINDILNSISERSIIVSDDNPLWLDMLIYFYICFAGPIMEELVFRGVLLDGLRKYGNRFGIIMSGILFGLFHQNIVQCIPAIIMGIVFAEMAVRSNSLIPSIFVHILNNSMSALLMIFINNVDLSALYSITDYTDLSSALTADVIAYMIIVSLNGLFRFVCLIAAILIVINYFSKGGKLVPSNEYTRSRTWSYLFTSLPWLLIIFFLLYETLTSLSFLA